MTNGVLVIQAGPIQFRHGDQPHLLARLGGLDGSIITLDDSHPNALAADDMTHLLILGLRLLRD